MMPGALRIREAPAPARPRRTAIPGSEKESHRFPTSPPHPLERAMTICGARSGTDHLDTSSRQAVDRTSGSGDGAEASDAAGCSSRPRSWD
jgi:hypothetical protein